MQHLTRCLVTVLVLAVGTSTFAQEPTTYVRYEYNGNVSYGVLEDERIHEIRGDIFTSDQRTGDTGRLRAGVLRNTVGPQQP